MEGNVNSPVSPSWKHTKTHHKQNKRQLSNINLPNGTLLASEYPTITELSIMAFPPTTAANHSQSSHGNDVRKQRTKIASRRPLLPCCPIFDPHKTIWVHNRHLQETLRENIHFDITRSVFERFLSKARNRHIRSRNHNPSGRTKKKTLLLAPSHQLFRTDYSPQFSLPDFFRIPYPHTFSRDNGALQHLGFYLGKSRQNVVFFHKYHQLFECGSTSLLCKVPIFV